MRKWNAVISGLMVALFLVHAVSGALELMGLYADMNAFVSTAAWALAACMLFHVVIGVKLTIDTIRACKKSGVSYFRENKLFWARRISGSAIVLFMIFHIVIFSGREVNGAYRLRFFGAAELVTQIFLVLSIALHVLTNVKPSLIALGIKNLKEYAVDLLIVLSLFFIFAGAAFFIYYIRWQI